MSEYRRVEECKHLENENEKVELGYDVLAYGTHTYMNMYEGKECQ